MVGSVHEAVPTRTQPPPRTRIGSAAASSIDSARLVARSAPGSCLASMAAERTPASPIPPGRSCAGTIVGTVCLLLRRGLDTFSRILDTFCHVWLYAVGDARLSPGFAAAPAPDPGPDDRFRAGRRARGVGADGASRRGGAERGGRADLRRARAAGRDPPGRWVPNPADGHDLRGSPGTLPVRHARTGGRARAWHGRGRRAAEGARGAPARTPRTGIAAGRAVPPRCEWLVPGDRGRSASGGPVRGGLGCAPTRDRIRALGSDRHPDPGAPRARHQGGHLVPGGAHGGPGSDISRVARGGRPPPR